MPIVKNLLSGSGFDTYLLILRALKGFNIGFHNNNIKIVDPVQISKRFLRGSAGEYQEFESGYIIKIIFFYQICAYRALCR